MKETTLVVVAEYNTITEAEITKSILQSAGIKSTIRNEYMSTNYLGAIPAQIMVSDSDFELAKKLLQNR
ncbi:MAG: DUF2007 domain-containing protein [Alistipes sp.]